MSVVKSESGEDKNHKPGAAQSPHLTKNLWQWQERTLPVMTFVWFS